jgi:hypothetical protein
MGNQKHVTTGTKQKALDFARAFYLGIGLNKSF